MGELELRDGCLLLDREVVFWPRGTGWDSAAESVTLPGPASARVGEIFDGGGGHYGPDVDFESLLGQEAGDLITRP